MPVTAKMIHHVIPDGVFNMEYHGKLYGRIGPNQYFETGKTSEDWDIFESKIEELTESYQLEQEENIRLVAIGESFVDEVNELKAKVSELNGYLEDRHKYIEELENTLGLRNRSNPDLTIDDESKSVFDKWKDCKD
jgi:hypothetical protein